MLWTRWVSQNNYLSAEVIWQMVQRHFKVLADALTFPRLVEPNPSCEPVGMWDGYTFFRDLISRFQPSGSSPWRWPCANDPRSPASSIRPWDLPQYPSRRGVHRKVDVGQPCSKRNIPFIYNNIWLYIYIRKRRQNSCTVASNML